MIIKVGLNSQELLLDAYVS